jgi:hypothetical protein
VIWPCPAWHRARNSLRRMEAVMKRTVLRVTFLAVLFVAFGVATAHADSRFSIHVGVGAPAGPVAVAPPPYPYGGYYYAPAPYPGYVWHPGYYVGYRWVPGAWVPGPRFAPYGRGYNKHNRYYKHDRRRW